MACLLSSASCLASALVSTALQFVSRFMRVSPLFHTVVKTLDRGKTKVPRGTPYLAPWAVESDLVVRVLALNPGGHTLQGTNCYLVGKGARRILIDTGEGKAGFVPHLLDVMKQAGCEMLDAILLTHWHADHVGGVSEIRKALGGDIPVFKKFCPRVQDFDYSIIGEGQLFRTTGATLEAVSTPGHTEDHVSLVLHEEKARALRRPATRVWHGYFRRLHLLHGFTAESPRHEPEIRRRLHEVVLWAWSRSGSCAREGRVLHQTPARKRSPNHKCVNGSKRADAQRSPDYRSGVRRSAAPDLRLGALQRFAPPVEAHE
ncbi:unnamed protein product [Ectocarpus sp. 8 AP-2014]